MLSLKLMHALAPAVTTSPNATVNRPPNLLLLQYMAVMLTCDITISSTCST